MLRNKTAKQHNFATVPRAEIPRSKIPMRQTRKQAFNASELVPIYCEEVLPGDTWSHNESVLARLATPIAPLMDDLDLETFYFFVPNRIVWEDWEDFITGVDSTLQLPGIQAVTTGPIYEVLPDSVFDHFGLLPGVYDEAKFIVNALPFFGYFTIWNEWFRDQNLQEEWTWPDNWTDAYSFSIQQDSVPWDQSCLRANKRHDYFTSSLPFAQKGPPVSIAFGSTAPIKTSSSAQVTGAQVAMGMRDTAGNQFLTNVDMIVNSVGSQVWSGAAPGAPGIGMYPDNLYADLATATAATINAIRLAFQTQKLLERDARGGSRYVEQLMSHWGVRSPDYRLQRPEYLGGSKIPVVINPIAQTATYEAEPGLTNSALGNLGAEMHASGSKHSFTYAATEHGYIIGLALVRATPTYQQGTRRHWRRRTRLDIFFPVFGALGEQAVATQEIYQPLGAAVPAFPTWGYQEHWAEYRYTPNEITGVLRSTNAQPLDWWHLSEEFGSEPALNASFITDKTQETLARSLATAPSEQWSAQIIMDILHTATVARLMPLYSVPGMIDHF